MNKILLFLSVIIMVSCTQSGDYEKYQNIPNGMWNIKKSIVFKVDITDTIHPKNVYIKIRHDNRFEYSNLFLISSFKMPNKQVVRDTLEYEMADLYGKWLGDGTGDVNESSLYFLEKYRFKNSGRYQFSFQQAMRERGKEHGIYNLRGVLDVGLKIENYINQ